MDAYPNTSIYFNRDYFGLYIYIKWETINANPKSKYYLSLLGLDYLIGEGVYYNHKVYRASVGN